LGGAISALFQLGSLSKEGLRSFDYGSFLTEIMKGSSFSVITSAMADALNSKLGCYSGPFSSIILSSTLESLSYMSNHDLNQLETNIGINTAGTIAAFCTGKVGASIGGSVLSSHPMVGSTFGGILFGIIGSMFGRWFFTSTIPKLKERERTSFSKVVSLRGALSGANNEKTSR